MNIQWSDQALVEMKSKFGNEATLWRLVYDSEGCGCSVDGVPTLWAVNATEPTDVQIGSNAVQVWSDPRHLIFFEDHVRISYLPEHRSFKLSSDGQTYTNRLKLQDRRD
ncbi:MAG: iron-sulfur cluster biosynthesis family protein [Candidatus Cohnella colombiensis]|uniref:Iron-sulfur cluster biosynthesis family protein n=1 Tax=Candidatus Cohnella colombiensis TaxID=3121368 RepID=A0AA95JGW4_9BACL|nr:MAG: iron-sulfur cluster biosynthesis family protein [Cohnella sp.]